MTLRVGDWVEVRRGAPYSITSPGSVGRVRWIDIDDGLAEVDFIYVTGDLNQFVWFSPAHPFRVAIHHLNAVDLSDDDIRALKVRQAIRLAVTDSSS